MPRYRGGVRGSQMKTSKMSKEPDRSKLACIEEWNNHYINNVKDGVGIYCDKCNKFRHVEEYEEVNEVPDFWECAMWNMGDGEKGNCYIPQLVDDEDYTDEKYTPGSIVWAKMKKYSRWPAIVGDDPDSVLYYKESGRQRTYHVVFFGDEFLRAWMKEEDVTPFSTPTPNELKHGKKRIKAIQEAMEVNKLKKDERVQVYLSVVKKSTKNVNNGSMSGSPEQPIANRLSGGSRASYKPQLPKEVYKPGDIVLAKMTGFPNWPGMVEIHPDKQKHFADIGGDACYNIVFFGNTVSRYWIMESDISEFPTSSVDLHKLRKNKKLRKPIEDAENAIQMDIQDRLKTYGFDARYGRKKTVADHNETKSEIVNQKQPRQRNITKRKINTSDCEPPVVVKKISPSPEQSNQLTIESQLKLSRKGPAREINKSGVIRGKNQPNQSTLKQSQERSTRMNSQPKTGNHHILIDENNNDNCDFPSERDGHRKNEAGNKNPVVEEFPVASASTDTGVKNDPSAKTQPPGASASTDKTRSTSQRKNDFLAGIPNLCDQDGNLLTSNETLWKYFIRLRKKYTQLRWFVMKISLSKQDSDGKCGRLCDRSRKLLTREQIVWRYHPFFVRLRNKHPELNWFTVIVKQEQMQQ